MIANNLRKAILLVAYGARNPQSRSGLQALESRCRARFPQTPIRWAYTSVISREYMASQRQKTDSVRKALLRLHYEKFTSVTIQPLQTIFGHEHEMVREAARKVCQETGLSCRVGLPLLGAMSELSAVASALLSYLPEERKVTDDVVFMGHGAHHAAMSQYEDLGRVLNGIDKHAHLGAMNGITMLNDILPRLKSGIVWLLPLLSIIGQHALRDMAGDNPRSWRSRIEAAGHVCKPVLRGMIENRSVSEIWLNHLSAAHAREAD